LPGEPATDTEHRRKNDGIAEPETDIKSAVGNPPHDSDSNQQTDQDTTAHDEGVPPGSRPVQPFVHRITLSKTICVRLPRASRAWPLAWPSSSGPVHRWIGQQIGIYGRSMARRDPDPDRRPACSACAADQIYDRSARIRRAAVRAGICREPYVLNLCEPHLARLQGDLPKGGVWVVRQYQPDGSEAESPVRQHD
jgi:hypothetical protein